MAVVLYRIGEFAELTGVSPKTLRHYDKMGLLRPAVVDVRTRYRCYATAQLRELSSILALRDLGLSLPEVRAFIARTGSCTDCQALLLRLRQRTKHAIERATESLSHIDAVLNQGLEQPGARMLTVPVMMKRCRAMSVASLRAEIQSYAEADILRLERQLMDAVPSESLGATRGVLWQRRAGSDYLIAEPFVEIRYRIPRCSFYDLQDLPPVTVACAFSSNDDTAAEDAYRAINIWMSVRGLSLASPKREICLGDMLEIQFPLNRLSGDGACCPEPARSRRGEL